MGAAPPDGEPPVPPSGAPLFLFVLPHAKSPMAVSEAIAIGPRRLVMFPLPRLSEGTLQLPRTNLEV
jgi:hypothetical protein